jgi:3-phosphoglycerate kinase
MFTKETIRDIDLKGKTVLLRADYNVPLTNGKITDDYRITQSLPTLHYLLSKDVKLIICSHVGRPAGPKDTALSLFPIAKRLKQLLDRPVEFVPDCVGPAAQKAAAGLKRGQVLLLENLRFHPEEKANDKEFAQKLADLAGPEGIFVQDGFGVVHRAHASTEAITHCLPSAAGLLLEKEVDTITNAMQQPKRPMAAIIGGAKIADKIDVLGRFVEMADCVAIGGGMANTFLAAQGIDVAASLYDKSDLGAAREILHKAAAETKKRSFTFAVPQDGIVATRIDKTAQTRIVGFSSHIVGDTEHYPKRPPASAGSLKSDEKILDVGPLSAEFIAGMVQLARTVVWNGTLGVTETKGLQGPVGPFAHGTQLLIEALLGDFGNKPFTVVGGGDTVGYLGERNLIGEFGHVSTGGGASLDLMSGRPLPGVDALPDK